MSIMRSRGFVIIGAITGGLLISCSDDTPGALDAGLCNCPAAEPPLDGRIRQMTRSREIGANEAGLVGVACDPGAHVLGGGCGGPDGIVADIVIRESLPNRGNVPGWYCSIRNNQSTPVTVHAMAFCLTPATN